MNKTEEKLKTELTKLRNRKGSGKYGDWDRGYDTCLDELEDLFGFDESPRDTTDYKEED